MTYPKTWGDVGSPEHGVAENKLRTAGQTMGDQPFYRVTTMSAEGQKLAGRDEIFIPPTGQPPMLTGVWGSPASGTLSASGGTEGGYVLPARMPNLYAFSERGSLKEKDLPPESRLQDMTIRLSGNGPTLQTVSIDLPKGLRGDDVVDWDTEPPRDTYPVTARYISNNVTLLSAVNVKDGYWWYSELPVSMCQVFGSMRVGSISGGGTYWRFDDYSDGRKSSHSEAILSTSYKNRSQSWCAFSTCKSAEKDEYGFNDIRPQFNYLRNGNLRINGSFKEAIFGAELPLQGGGTGRNFTTANSARLSGGDAVGLFFEYVRRSESAAGNGSGWIYRVTSAGVARPAVELVLPASYKGLEFDAPLFDNPYLSPISQGFTGTVEIGRFPGSPTKETSSPNAQAEGWVSDARNRNAALDIASASCFITPFDGDRALISFNLPAVWAGWTPDPRPGYDNIVNAYTQQGSSDTQELALRVFKSALNSGVYDNTMRTLFYLYADGAASQIELPFWTTNLTFTPSSLKIADNCFLMTASESQFWTFAANYGYATHLLLTTDNGSTWTPFPATGLPRSNRIRIYDGEPSVLKFKAGRATEIGITANEDGVIYLYTFMPEYDSNGILKTNNVKWNKRQALYKKIPYVAFDYGRTVLGVERQNVEGYDFSPPGRTGYVGTYFQRYIGYDRKRYGRDPLVQLPEYFNP